MRPTPPGAGGVEPRVFLGAVVGPAAAFVIDRELGGLLRDKARALSGVRPDVARQLEVARMQLAEAGRQWWAGQVGTPGTGPDLGVGTSATTGPVDGSASGVLLDTGLTVGEAAEKLGVSERQVRYLITRTRSLSARRDQGRWLIDPVSVDREASRRAG